MLALSLSFISLRINTLLLSRFPVTIVSNTSYTANAILKMVPHPYALCGLQLHLLALLPHPQMQSGLTTTLVYWVMVSLTASTHVPTATRAMCATVCRWWVICSLGNRSRAAGMKLHSFRGSVTRG